MTQSNEQAEIKAILEEYHSIVTDELGKGLIEALLAYRKQHELEAEIRELKALMRLIDDRSGAPLTKTELGNRIVAKSERLGKL